jgi:tellurite resistance protein TerC
LFRQIKRIIVAVVGFTVLAIGIALLVLPGPAFIVIPAGIAILATEFVWARRILNKVKERFKKKNKTKQDGIK